MTQHTDSFSLRAAVEKLFAGFTAALTVAVIYGGTVAMCFPGIA